MSAVPKALQAIVRAAELFNDHPPTDQISLRFDDGTVLTVADLRAVRDYFNPAPTYTIARCVRTGYRGGKRADGWNIVRGEKLMGWSQWKAAAQEKADLLNSLQTPLTEAPALEVDYWRLTLTGHWLHCWSGSPDDLQALHEGRAFAAMEKSA